MHRSLKRNASTVVLARGELVSILPGGKTCRIACVTGRLWVTADGQREDDLLAPGEEATFAGRRRIVVEALRTATVRLEIPGVADLRPNPLLPLGRLPEGLST